MRYSVLCCTITDNRTINTRSSAPAWAAHSSANMVAVYGASVIELLCGVCGRVAGFMGGAVLALSVALSRT